MQWRRFSPMLTAALIIVMMGGCKAPTTAEPAEVSKSAAAADNFRQALEQPITVNVSRSPDGNQLTVQFAAISICKAAGDVPYQFEKSQKLAGDDCRRFVAPLQVGNIPASQALSNLLAPLNLRYEVDNQGVYLTR